MNGEAIADITSHEVDANHSNRKIGLQVHGVRNITVPDEIA